MDPEQKEKREARAEAGGILSQLISVEGPWRHRTAPTSPWVNQAALSKLAVSHPVTRLLGVARIDHSSTGIEPRLLQHDDRTDTYLCDSKRLLLQSGPRSLLLV